MAIDKNNPVNNVKLTDVTFDKALRTVLEDVGGVNPLGYIIKDGVITISTRDDLSRHTTMRIYDVRDLISLDPLSGQDEVGGIDPLNTVTDIIRTSVERSSWIDNSGTLGSMKTYEGMLVVTQTSENHDGVEAVLTLVRQARFRPWELDLMRKFAVPVAKVDIRNARFEKVVQALRDVGGLNIVLDPAIRAKAPPPVTLKANSISVRQVLNLIVRMEGLAWTAIDGVIYVTRPAGGEPPPAASASAEPTSPAAIGPAAVQADASDLKRTVITAELGHDLPKDKNVLWCASFQLAWNELMDYAGGPVTMPGGPAMVAALNRRDFTKDDIDDASVVAVAGQVGQGVLTDAKAQLLRKFPDFEPRLLKDAEGLPPDAIAMYACLIKQMPFEHRFAKQSLAFGSAAADRPNDRVGSFGISKYAYKDAKSRAVAEQIKILSHRFVPQGGGFTQQFVVELSTEAKDDRLILAMIEPGESLRETIAEATRLIARPNTLVPKKLAWQENALAVEPGKLSSYVCLLPEETLDVPVLDIDILRDFQELEGNLVKAKNPKLNGLPCILAQQTIRFKLNETGAKLESEAVMAFGSSEPQKRDFTFNRPFLVMLMRKGSTKPYFAAWIANDELMVREPAKPDADAGK